ncbi:MAG: hypothetical protein ACO1O6_13770 [Bacteroidota bacterium]
MIWNSFTGKYQLQCKICEREFYGRKNQVYCNVKCKSKAANDKTALLNELNSESGAMRKNCYILQQLFPVKQEIDKTTLINLGFNTKSAFKKLQIKENKGIVFSYGHYGISPLNEDSSQFLIVKLRDHGTD